MQAPINSKKDQILNKLKELKIDATLLVLSTFVLLQIFRVIHLLLPSKTLESIFVIPFQLLIFLIPTYLFARFKDQRSPMNYIMKLRMKLPRLYQLPLIAAAIVTISAGCLLISLAFGGASSTSEGFTLYNTFVSRSNFGFFESIYLIVAYAAVPAVCEELIFRAILCREFERYNVVCAIVASSLFLALLHFDLSLFPVYLFAGIFLALCMYATGSVIVPMIIHFFYNVIGLFGQPYLNAFYEITGGSTGLFAFIVFIIGMLAAALFCTFASKSYKRRAEFSRIPDHPLFPKSDALVHIVSEILLTPWSIAAVCFYIVVIIIYSLI